MAHLWSINLIPSVFCQQRPQAENTRRRIVDTISCDDVLRNLLLMRATIKRTLV